MILKWKNTRKFVFFYLLGYFVFCLLLFVEMRWYKNRNFSPKKLETMLSTVSSLRDKTDDPCKYAIYGEPATAQLQYVKVNIFCSANSKSINTMDLRAIKGKTVAGAIQELGRVNGFPVKITSNNIVIGNRYDLKNSEWTCMQNRVKVSNLNETIAQKGSIDCFNGLTKEGIVKFYETY